MRYVKFFDPADPEHEDWTPVEHIVTEDEAIELTRKAAGERGKKFYENNPELAFQDFVTVVWGEIIYDDEETRF